MEQEAGSAPSLNAFKGRLDKFWKNYKYTVDPDSRDIHWKQTSNQPKGPIGLMSVDDDQGIKV